MQSKAKPGKKGEMCVLHLVLKPTTWLCPICSPHASALVYAHSCTDTEDMRRRVEGGAPNSERWLCALKQAPTPQCRQFWTLQCW